jgi:hypothetical protein
LKPSVTLLPGIGLIHRESRREDRHGHVCFTAAPDRRRTREDAPCSTPSPPPWRCATRPAAALAPSDWLVPETLRRCSLDAKESGRGGRIASIHDRRGTHHWKMCPLTQTF